MLQSTGDAARRSSSTAGEKGERPPVAGGGASEGEGDGYGWWWWWAATAAKVVI